MTYYRQLVRQRPSLVTPRMTKYIPHRPTPKQTAFLLLPHLEALYGGAAGGGKSDALLMAALQYVDVPGYSALLLRRSYADLALPDAIMSRAHEWLRPYGVKWREDTKTFYFSSGATLSFGYLQYENDKFRYQSSAFQFIGFDELTQFEESQYIYLFSRLRRLESASVPIRMRDASNPGGIGHQWVYERFVANQGGGRIFVPAKLDENPHLDQEQYERSLQELDETTKKQLLEGLWVTDPRNKPFKREWWRGQNRYHLSSKKNKNMVVSRWISWDTALKDKEENAYTAYVVGEITSNYTLQIRLVWRGRPIFPELPQIMETIARQWDYDEKLQGIIIEDKASGTTAYQTLIAQAPAWIRPLLVAWQPKVNKEERANQAGVWCKRDCILLPHPDGSNWLPDFENELFNFPDSTFADQVDAFSQLIIYLEHWLAVGWHSRIGEYNFAKSPKNGRDNRVTIAMREAGY